MEKKILYYIIIFLVSLSCSVNDKVNQKYKINNRKYNAASQGQRIRYIVVHYTHADDDTSIMLLTEQAVSSHYLITTKKRDPIYQLVDDKHRAWHAGESAYDGRYSINDSSIGIEIVHMGYDEEAVNKYARKRKKNDLKLVNYDDFYDYNEAQIDKLAFLLRYLVEKYDIHPKNILGHSDVSPTRKQDPGPKFPWESLYNNYDIGIWYEKEDVSLFMTNKNYEKSSISDIKEEFIEYGYSSMPTNSVWDKESRQVVAALQSRFRSKKVDGNIDKETYAIIRALNKKVKDIKQKEHDIKQKK